MRLDDGNRWKSRGLSLAPPRRHLLHVITGLVPVIPIGKARRSSHRDGRVKPGHDERGCDPGQCHAPPRHHRSHPVIAGPRTLRRHHHLRRHHRARPGDPDKEKLRAPQHRDGRHKAGHDVESVIRGDPRLRRHRPPQDEGKEVGWRRAGPGLMTCKARFFRKWSERPPNGAAFCCTHDRSARSGSTPRAMARRATVRSLEGMKESSSLSIIVL
jgi:hypothetical protein